MKYYSSIVYTCSETHGITGVIVEVIGVIIIPSFLMATAYLSLLLSGSLSHQSSSPITASQMSL